MKDRLVEACESKKEAEDAMIQHAKTIKRTGWTEEFGVYVRQMAGGWGVWLKDRRGT